MEPENNQVASIYERMLYGDKQALSDLQKVHNYQYGSESSPQKSSNKPSHNHLPSEQKNRSPPKPNKEGSFKNYLREKVTELRNVKLDSKKQLSKIDNSIEFKERKPFPKTKNRTQTHDSQKNNQSENIGIPSVNKIIDDKGANLNKVKTTSNNFQQKINKNIIKDEKSHEKERKSIKNQSTPPSSKNSFRIRNKIPNKKLMDNLLRINEDQRRLQMEIMVFHNQTKDKLNNILEKYSLEERKIQKESKKTTLEDQLMEQSSTISKLVDSSKTIEQQEFKIQKKNKILKQVDEELIKIKQKIENKQTTISNSPLLPYLNQFEDIFEERESEEEGDEVKDLPLRNEGPTDPTKTYSSMMGQIKKKNWSLNQRLKYQSSKSEDAVSNVKKIHFNDSNGPQNQQNDDNKVIVNERLKEYLFQ